MRWNCLVLSATILAREELIRSPIERTRSSPDLRWTNNAPAFAWMLRSLVELGGIESGVMSRSAPDKASKVVDLRTPGMSTNRELDESSDASAKIKIVLLT